MGGNLPSNMAVHEQLDRNDIGFWSSPATFPQVFGAPCCASREGHEVRRGEERGWPRMTRWSVAAEANEQLFLRQKHPKTTGKHYILSICYLQGSYLSKTAILVLILRGSRGGTRFHAMPEFVILEPQVIRIRVAFSVIWILLGCLSFLALFWLSCRLLAFVCDLVALVVVAFVFVFVCIVLLAVCAAVVAAAIVFV